MGSLARNVMIGPIFKLLLTSLLSHSFSFSAPPLHTKAAPDTHSQASADLLLINGTEGHEFSLEWTDER